MPSSSLLVGRAVKAWGLAGDVKVEPCADSMAILEGVATVQVRRAAGDVTWYAVERIRRAGAAWILKLCGVDSVEQAAPLVGGELLIPRSAAPPLPEGTYYHADLVGLRVKTEGGRDLGRIVDIWVTGANDVYVVQGEHGEWLLPATREVVRRVDLEGEIMLICPLEGMIEAEAV